MCIRDSLNDIYPLLERAEGVEVRTVRPEEDPPRPDLVKDPPQHPVELLWEVVIGELPAGEVEIDIRLDRCHQQRFLPELVGNVGHDDGEVREVRRDVINVYRLRKPELHGCRLASGMD